MGTEDSKYELVKSMFGGASIHAIKEAFKTSSGKTPCVYLFVIGNANELLKTDKYTKDTLLYKFGTTDDLPRRSGEHERDFRRMFKLDHIELMLFSVIDPKYIFDAETSLKDYFKLNKIEFKNTNELIVLNKMEYEKATKHYKLIKNSYIGCYMEMQDKIDKLERRLKDIQNEYDLSKEKMGNKLVVKEKDIEMIKQQHINEMASKESNLEMIKQQHMNEMASKESNLEMIKQQHMNEISTKENEMYLLKEKHQHELSIKEKDKMIEFNDVLIQLKEKEHQNELLLMKTQLLELQLKQYMQKD